MTRSAFWLSGLAGVLTLAAGFGACSAGSANGSGGGGGFGGSGQSSSKGSDSGGGGSMFNPTLGGGGEKDAGGPCMAGGPDDDVDGDGWTPAQGDCNDCDPNINPGAIEVIAPPDADGGTPKAFDENCDGIIDNVDTTTCDSGFPLSDFDAAHGANTIGICKVASVDGTRGKPGYSYGLMSAAYVLANGKPVTNPGLAIGIMPTFGPNVHAQEGENMLVLSSGNARTKDQPDQCGMDSCEHGGPHAPPMGFPAKVPGCPGGQGTQINDDIALQVGLRAPTNATGYSFKFKFHSFEFPEYVCTEYNDQFVALVNPPPMGAINGNITFDSNNNPVSVNIAFFDVCDPSLKSQWAANCSGGNCPPVPNPFCPSGPSQLEGTGFEGGWGNTGGGTSWLQTQAPVSGGEEFTIRFAIWDTGDHELDSTVLIDDFSWIAGAGSISVGTGKVPVPK